MDKNALRRRARADRAAIAPDNAARAAQNIAQLFFEHEIAKDINEVRAVALYMPIRNEISPLPLLAALDERGVACALPVVRGEEQPLMFRAYQPDDPLIAGAYGILEPAADRPEVEPEMILVPLLAFDSYGTRLGYGAGHYDRTLEFFSGVAVGLAYASQRSDNLPRAPHDVALRYILTEKSWLACDPPR